MSRKLPREGAGSYRFQGECVVSESRGTLSAYRPPAASARAPAELELPLKIYIIETVELQARSKQLRELGIVVALVIGIVASVGQVAWDSAKVVPNLPVSAQDAGMLAVDALAPRLTFGTGLQASF